jgi:hypothetical protein
MNLRIFSVNETWLFFRLSLIKTVSLKGNPCNGFKNPKERITFMLVCNADGTEKFLALFTGASKTPNFFKNARKMPTGYETNRKAWLIQAIFTDYVNAKCKNKFPKYLC